MKAAAAAAGVVPGRRVAASASLIIHRDSSATITASKPLISTCQMGSGLNRGRLFVKTMD